MSSLRNVGSTSRARLEKGILKYLHERGGDGKKFELAEPQSRAGSGAVVYIVKENGVETAAFKIFMDHPGTLMRELASIDVLKQGNLKDISPVDVLDVAKITIDGVEQPVLLMKRAKGTDLEQMIRETARSSNKADVQKMKEAVTAAAKGLAEVHRKYRDVNPTESTQAATQAMRNYEADAVLSFTRRDGPLDKYLEMGWITQDEHTIARVRISKIAQQYREFGKSPVTVAHGDSHQGNIFFDSATGRVQLIDVETMAWSLNRRSGAQITGIIDATADVGRFHTALEVNGKASALDPKIVRELQEAFMNAYSKASGRDLEAIEQTIRFYRMRFLGKALSDFGVRKYMPEDRQQFLDMLMRDLGARSDSRDAVPAFKRLDAAVERSLRGIFGAPFRPILDWKFKRFEKTFLQSVKKNYADVPVEHRPYIHTRGYRTKQAVVLIHGIGESPRRMNQLAEMYQNAGINVITVLLKGHGRNPVDLHDAGKLAAWRSQIDEAVAQAHVLGDKVLVAGHSLGGNLAIDAGLRLQGKGVDGVFGYSPGVEMSAERAEFVQKMLDRHNAWVKENLDKPWTESPAAWWRTKAPYLPGATGYEKYGLVNIPSSIYGEVKPLQDSLRVRLEAGELKIPFGLAWGDRDPFINPVWQQKLQDQYGPSNPGLMFRFTDENRSHTGTVSKEFDAPYDWDGQLLFQMIGNMQNALGNESVVPSYDLTPATSLPGL